MATSRRADQPPGSARSHLLWAGFAAPGIVWLLVLFVVPFYAVLAIAGGQLSPLIESAVPTWNPLHWQAANFVGIWHDFVGSSSFVGPVLLRTVVYVAVASALSLLIAYPVAYFVTRFGGRRKGIFLALLVAPFWISYMMRMLAWIDLLQTDGYVNHVLLSLHLVSQPVDWLGGDSTTVVLGLVYGYIPYLILVLYSGLDRIDPRLVEAGRDLGLGSWRTFLRVTLPLSRQSILTGVLITTLPMFGDYFTNQMLSGSAGTSMIGNVIDGQLTTSSLQGQGAVLSLGLLLILLVPMLYYAFATNRAARELT